jgi:dimethylhistidine N-methyltransferase
MMPPQSQLQRTKCEQQFFADMVCGLTQAPKRLSCKYFYDERGSALFDQICELDEYYLTRTELSIMQQNGDEIAEQLGRDVRLVEYGSGSSTKTRILLDHLQSPLAYVPVDISSTHLLAASSRLQAAYPTLKVQPVVADFTRPFAIPESDQTAAQTTVYFPGSTIGNFAVDEAQSLLSNIARLCGPGGGLLIGIDLEKDPRVLERAYDDGCGVTAEFNLNLLHRMRNELDADLDLDGFEHHSRYNARLGRVEIFIRSLKSQQIEIDGNIFPLREGELILTEYSHKYTVERFVSLAARAGFELMNYWTDDKKYFAVLYLVARDCSNAEHE